MTKKEMIAFYDKQPFVMLTTMNGAAPETRALINIRNANIAPHLAPYFKDSDRILLMTNTHTDKIKQMRENETANLYVFDGANFAAVLLIGKVREVLDRKTIEDLWDDSWKIYYPDGRDGGDFSVLEFAPEAYKTYGGTDGFKKESGSF